MVLGEMSQQVVEYFYKPFLLLTSSNKTNYTSRQLQKHKYSFTPKMPAAPQMSFY
jgi:hypothetical protein